MKLIDLTKVALYGIAAASLLFSAREVRADRAPTLALGDAHTCALIAGRVTCWGSNISSQLGPVNLGVAFTSKPLQLHGVQNVVALAAKANDTCVVFQDGGVMCFGEHGSRWPYKRVKGIQDAVDVTVGRGHTCVLRSTGRVSCWGDNTYGQLGLGNNWSTDTPTHVLALADIMEVKAGDFHTCARISNGSVACWGLNSSGQLGNGATTNANFPTWVPGEAAASMFLGSGHSCIQSPPDGRARCWGNNFYGQFGNSATNPAVLWGTSAVPGQFPSSQSAGYAHGCWVIDSKAWCAGNNGDGRLGIGSIDFVNPVPSAQVVLVADLRALSNVAQVYAGGQHTCAWKWDGSVYCWGNDRQGQLASNLAAPFEIFAKPVVGLNEVIFEDGFEHY